MTDGIPRDDPKPIVDLQPLLELPEWFHAVWMFRDQGTTKPTADLLEPLEGQLRKQETNYGMVPSSLPEAIKRYQQANQIKNSVGSLTNYAFVYSDEYLIRL